MPLFKKSKIRLYKSEKVPCKHCSGTGKCTCGKHYVDNVTSIKGSLKDCYGISVLCLGVCDVCKGKGYSIEETFEEVLVEQRAK